MLLSRPGPGSKTPTTRPLEALAVIPGKGAGKGLEPATASQALP